MDSGSTHATEEPTEKERSLREWLESSTKELVEMSQSRYPLGKLGHLKAAHKNIVDTLASSHPSASADDILPVLILALVTVPPEDLHVVSDLHFIQYFRWEYKLTGEAAYCLTNLEAAIAFLQSLDLSTLRPDESVSGPVKDTAQQGSKPGTFPPAYLVGAATDSDSEGKSAQPGTSMGLKAATVLRNRRFSDIVNNPAQAFGFASDAVLNTADQGFKNISTSLGDSYKFLLGKIKEHQEGPKEPIAVPRTLDDARRLVSTPEEDATSVDDQDDVDYLKHPMQRDDRVLNLIGGRRDRSADSAVSGRSATSAKKVLFVDEPRPAAAAAAAPSPGQSPAVLEQMRLLGTTFNPVARLTSLGRGLARNVSSPVGTPPATKTAEAPAAEGGDLATVSRPRAYTPSQAYTHADPLPGLPRHRSRAPTQEDHHGRTAHQALRGAPVPRRPEARRGTRAAARLPPPGRRPEEHGCLRGEVMIGRIYHYMTLDFAFDGDGTGRDVFRSVILWRVGPLDFDGSLDDL